MENSQTIQDFDAEFFKNIAVPLTRDYSRLSSSPNRDAETDSCYFERFNQPVKCDTPIKMRLPKAEEASEEEQLITNTNENFLRKSSEVEVAKTVEIPSKPSTNREPLKIVPNETQTYGEVELIDDLSRLAMFAPKAPEERLSQRRRSEQKKKVEEENKRRSVSRSTSRARSTSVVQKAIPSRDSSKTRIPVGRTNSVTRVNSVSTTGVVTRSMAKAADGAGKTPLVRRSVMPVKINANVAISGVGTTPVDRSRDRARRTNTTGQRSTGTRRSVMPKAGASSSTPVAPPRRAASTGRSAATNDENKLNSKARPIATANRTSTLRANALLAQKEAKKDEPTVSKQVVSRPVVHRATGVKKGPLKLQPAPASTTATEENQASSKVGSSPMTRPVRQFVRATTPVGRLSTSTGQTSANREQNAVNKRLSSSQANALFSRLAAPKAASTPMRGNDATKTEVVGSAQRKFARPVPSFIRSVTKTGLPTGGGLHGLRAPSRERNAANSSGSSNVNNKN